MSAAVLDRPVVASQARTVPAPRGDGGPMLDGIIAGAWEGLASHRDVGCPVCGGRMAPRYGASGLAPVGGRCVDCGTSLG